jgi:hypothetical protein
VAPGSRLDSKKFHGEKRWVKVKTLGIALQYRQRE